MKLFITVCLLCCLIPFNTISAQSLDSLDIIRQQFEREAGNMRAEFLAYEAKAMAEYEEYLNSIKKIWGSGENQVLADTKTKWVEYSPNMQQRSIVDFETGEVLVEIAVDPSQSKDSTQINNLMAQAIERMLSSRGSTCPYPSSVDKAEPITAQPILENLIDLSQYSINNKPIGGYSEPATSVQKTNAPPAPVAKGGKLNIQPKKPAPAKPKTTPPAPVAKKKEESKKPVESKKPATADKPKEKAAPVPVKQVAAAIASQTKKEKTQTKGTDGKNREIVQVKMKLVSDNIPKNAALYKDLIAEFSNRFSIEQPLIYAIMEQESAFNPQARSGANAIGLMQIVPRTAGIDAYNYVYKENKMPEVSYLYNPRNNIELGTAYLRILSNMFKKVEDDGCRQLCMIASYNTGAGNVSKAFTGNTNLSKALSHINTFDYDNLYNHLLKKLPHAETRDYVKKVTQKKTKYLK